MLLDVRITEHATTSRKPLGKLLVHYGNTVLDDFFVSEYLDSGRLPVVQLNGKPARTPALSYYNDELYFTCDRDELLSRTGKHASRLRGLFIFPLRFCLHVYHTGLVAEIEPATMETEFVRITPKVRGTSGIPEGQIAMIAIAQVTAGDGNARLGLLRKVDTILEYLRSGRGKKPRFLGLF